MAYVCFISLQLQTVDKDLLKQNCTTNVTVTNDSVISYILLTPQGEQSSAEWLGLHTLPSGSDRYEDSLPYYISVSIT